MDDIDNLHVGNFILKPPKIIIVKPTGREYIHKKNIDLQHSQGLSYKIKKIFSSKEKNFDELSQDLKEIAIQSSNNNGIQKRKKILKFASYKSNNLCSYIVSSKWIFPYFSLLCEDNDFFLNSPITIEILNNIKQIIAKKKHKRLGSLSIRQALYFFFFRYDDIKILKEYIYFLQEQLSLFDKNKVNNVLANIIKDKDYIISKDYHINIKYILKNDNLSYLIDTYGINKDTKYYQRVQMVFYINKLKELKPNQNSNIFNYIVNNRSNKMETNKNWLLGHEAVKILMEKLIDSNKTPSEEWKNVILNIAGDPRVNKSHKHYTRWWSQIGNELYMKMIEWMSEVDIKLFLDIYKDYCDKSHSIDLKRMFPIREKFISGLLNKKLIKQTRLFLTSQAYDYLWENCKEFHSGSYTHLSGSGNGFAAVFLNLGNAYIIEGSHSFKIHIFDKIPKDSAVSDYKDRCNTDELRNGVEEKYIHQFGTGNYFKIAHRKNKLWIEDSVYILRELGIHINISDVSDEKY